MFQSDTEASDIEGAELDVDESFEGDAKKKVKKQTSIRLHVKQKLNMKGNRSSTLIKTL